MTVGIQEGGPDTDTGADGLIITCLNTHYRVCQISGSGHIYIDLYCFHFILVEFDFLFDLKESRHINYFKYSGY